MIDLHLHTTYSDGQHNVRGLIELLNKEKIKYASITDHNHIGAFVEYQENDYHRLFHGEMIPGTEIQVLFHDYVVEVLVYYYRVREFEQVVNLTRKQFWNFHNSAYQKLLSIADSLGISYVEPQKKLQNGYYANTKFHEAIASCYEENKKRMDEKCLTDCIYFYRSEFQNPNSTFFIDNKQAFPNIKDFILQEKECGGITSLAHIEEYCAIERKQEFLDALVNETKIDAIECFHPSIAKEKTPYYMDYAKKHNLLVSAGSDFHGETVTIRRHLNTKATANEVNILKIR